ncbi:MAG: endonuclease/exonuclease/phosphatase family protein [Planctomycetes bacterium]|nr:endonuclease/exonuclease/phosphatase family protein [Planctomycetota bacterium]
MKSNAAAPRRGKQALFWIVLHSATALLALLTLLAFAARWSWHLELLCHFRAQFALCAGLALVVYLLGRRFFAAECTVVLFAYLLWGLLPYWLPFPRPVEVDANDPLGKRLSPPVRLVSFNVYVYNDRYEEAVKYIESIEPDLVAFYEVTHAWANGLEPLRAKYPHVYSYPDEGSFGLQVMSRQPLEDARLEKPLGVDGAVFTARMPLDDGQRLALVVAHPPPPTDAGLAHIRKVTLKYLARRVNESPGPLALIGDLNCTPWSPLFSDLCRDGELGDARRSFGLQPTWPMWLPIYFRLPIDHCLLRGRIRVVSNELGRECGSDHRPIIVELSVLPPIQ